MRRSGELVRMHPRSLPAWPKWPSSTQLQFNLKGFGVEIKRVVVTFLKWDYHWIPLEPWSMLLK